MSCSVVAADNDPIQTIVFGSCIKQDRPVPILVPMRAEQPQLTLFIGDNIYADTSDISVMRAKYQQLKSNKDFDALVNACPTMATWDDHDYGVNDGGADFAKRDEAQQAFLDFWNVPKVSPRRTRSGVFDSRGFGPAGKRVQVVMLDTRYFRSPLKKGERRVGGPYYPDSDETKTMLGDQQWKWLRHQLTKPAEVRLIVSSIQFAASASGQETWSNLPLERQKFLSLLDETKAAGVLVISGDRHWAELSKIDRDGSYPIYDLTSSSLNQIHQRGTPTENRFRISETTYHKENYGVIRIRWDRRDPEITMQVQDLESKTQIEKTIHLSELQPRN